MTKTKETRNKEPIERNGQWLVIFIQQSGDGMACGLTIHFNILINYLVIKCVREHFIQFGLKTLYLFYVFLTILKLPCLLSLVHFPFHSNNELKKGKTKELKEEKRYVWGCIDNSG